MCRPQCFFAALACLGILGCSSPNVNPTHAHANTGYVDFYTDTDLSLSWEVKRASQPGAEMKTVFSEFSPVEGNILRLAAPPGSYQFQVWFINRVTQGPETVTVPVQGGEVTPVHVTLAPAGSTTVSSKEYGFRGSAKGYGRGTKIVTDPSQVFQIQAVAATPQAYQTKERMPYFSAPAPK